MRRIDARRHNPGGGWTRMPSKPVWRPSALLIAMYAFFLMAIWGFGVLMAPLFWHAWALERAAGL